LEHITKHTPQKVRLMFGSTYTLGKMIFTTLGSHISYTKFRPSGKLGKLSTKNAKKIL